jgi:hypothetical protein
MPQVDLVEVAKFCVALLMLALTVGVCAVIVGAVVAGFRKGGEDR